MSKSPQTPRTPGDGHGGTTRGGRLRAGLRGGLSRLAPLPRYVRPAGRAVLGALRTPVQDVGPNVVRAVRDWAEHARLRIAERELAHNPPPAPRADPETMLRKLEWTVIRRLDGLLQSDYRTLFRGFGLDFADLREYQPNDDVRHIDWNVTARMQVPHVREFQEDREVAAWFVLDLSGSIDFGSHAVRKRALSSEFVTVLARLLTRYGNRVGAILNGDGTHELIPARVGRRHVLHLVDRVLDFGVRQPGAGPADAARRGGKRARKAPPAGRETDLAAVLQRALPLIRRRSVVFIVSDFISSTDWTRALSLLARRHEVVAVRLYDPLEVALPDLGLVVMQDAETGEQMFVDTADGAFRKRFAEAAARRERALRNALAEAGVDCLELATDDRLDEALLRFMRLRKQRSRMAAGASSAAVSA
jgi:uncharacterized protein (DUF58 family)